MVELPSFPSFVWDLLVIDTPKGEDLILGFDFLNHFNPYTYWRKVLITFNADNKNYHDPSKSFSNDISPAKSCAALAGDSRTPSFLSSVHIPSLNSQQSLLSSRDEVLKQIQDVGETILYLHFISFLGIWIYLLHLIMTPWRSYSLDVFSKVKAEKLPPHHACDHHINLEGSLPPVEVIYSLSNQESDTLRAYISESVEKGFIQPSSSSTGAPVLFVKKKDGGLCLCVDWRKLNAVTRKNKYPVPPINQLLTVFDGSSILSNIHLHGLYNLLRIKEGDEYLTAFRTKYGSYAIWTHQCSCLF
ncbi:hypothetical protein O181_097488 [Austropuccinia psidii MF-1]|uniref:Reverse transcriptase domain-containing protein n=1 Tax=Austropuccinia psidii MF-1 TaxID=1389203 RepID=A0A9Q3J901_9BASI|nr:hypothetical protein [Austropuccinia psidii MF-1]